MKYVRFLSVLSVIAISVFIVSCSGSKNAVMTRSDLKGQWIVTSTEITGVANTGNLKITSFDDVDLSCFVNSEWSLPNNSYGSYTINASNCNAGTRSIIWSQKVINGITYLNFKKMDGVSKSNAKNVAEGYSLEITSAETNHFIARTPVTFEGNTIYIVYHFNKK